MALACVWVVWGLGTSENCKPTKQDTKERDTRTYVCLQFVIQMWALLDVDGKASHLQSLHFGLVVVSKRARELMRSRQARVGCFAGGRGLSGVLRMSAVGWAGGPSLPAPITLASECG